MEQLMTKTTNKLGPKTRHYAIPRNVMLTEEIIEKARRIGKGNLSAGVRKAVTEYPMDANTARASDDQA